MEAKRENNKNTGNTVPFKKYIKSYGPSRMGTFVGTVTAEGIRRGMTLEQISKSLNEVWSSPGGQATIKSLIVGAMNHAKQKAVVHE